MTASGPVHYVIGAGSVGTVLAGHLARAGRNVVLQVRPGRLDAYQQVDTLRIVDADDRLVAEQPAPRLVDSLQADGLACVYLAVKYPDLSAVLEQLDSQLPPGVVLAPCLNGVGLAQTLAQRFPDNPVAPLTIMFNARVESALSVRLTTRAEILVGGDDRAAVIDAFAGSGMAVKRASESTEWGKLLINLNNAVCAVTGTGFADLFSDAGLSRAFVLVMDEAVAVFKAAGKPVELPAPIPYGLYRWLLLHARALPLFVARRKNGLSDQAYPSMLADLQRGRPTEIAVLNGVIESMGREQGLATPVNTALIKLVRTFESGARPDYLSPGELVNILEQT